MADKPNQPRDKRRRGVPSTIVIEVRRSTLRSLTMLLVGTLGLVLAASIAYVLSLTLAPTTASGGRRGTEFLAQQETPTQAGYPVETPFPTDPGIVETPTTDIFPTIAVETTATLDPAQVTATSTETATATSPTNGTSTETVTVTMTTVGKEPVVGKEPLPTYTPTITPTATATPTPTSTPAPTAIPVDVISGTVRWTVVGSPYWLVRDQIVTAGSTLLIDPGVEVQLAPGVRFFVEGQLIATGAPGSPVRFRSSTPGQRWEGFFGRPGHRMLFDGVELLGGGSGGHLLVSERGELVLKSALITDNGGVVQTINTRYVELQHIELSGNDMEYGAPLDLSYDRGGFLILADMRVGGNRVQAGAPSVRVASTSPIDTLVMDVQRNLIQGGTPDSPALELFTDGALQGTLACNTLQTASVGFALHSSVKQVPGFNLRVENNALYDNTPSIVPDYLPPGTLLAGLGRAASSDIALDMTNNWWGASSGAYDPERNPQGRGDAVGSNIRFEPWLSSQPACTPRP